MLPKRIAIVGNAPLHIVSAAQIDACDKVVRFNKARGWRAETGSRVDTLYLVNHGGQMAEWLMEDTLTTLPQVLAANTIALPIPLLEGHIVGSHDGRTCADPDRVNFLDGAASTLRASGKSVVAHSIEDYERAVAKLCQGGPSNELLHPSSGFLALSRLLDCEHPDSRFLLTGFTFSGWSGHPWEREREFVRELQDAGRIELA